MSDDGRGYLAPAQAAVRFCMTREVFPLFLAWVRAAYPDEDPAFFEAGQVMVDLTGVHDVLQPAENALIEAGFDLEADRACR